MHGKRVMETLCFAQAKQTNCNQADKVLMHCVDWVDVIQLTLTARVISLSTLQEGKK